MRKPMEFPERTVEPGTGMVEVVSENGGWYSVHIGRARKGGGTYVKRFWLSDAESRQLAYQLGKMLAE